MADLTITAGNVVKGTGADVGYGTAGAAITAGQPVYEDTATRKFLLADSNGAASARVPDGISLHGAAVNQPIAFVKSGPVTIGATLTAGEAYYLSDTPGGICPRADVGTGENTVLLGLATSTTVLNVDIQASGVQL